MIGCAANSGLNWTRGRRLEIKKAAVPNKATRKHQSGAQRLPNYSHTHWTGRLTIIRAMFSIGEKMEFLIGNPFSTPVGQRVERATIGSLQSEDWGLNIEICDIINETDEGPRDAVKAIKKRIIGNKNFREIMLALTVLEACVKNCGHRFHILVGSQEFVEGVLVRCILPKYNPPTTLHDRVLSLIQSIPENGTPEMAAVAPATHPPQPQVPPEATTLNTSPPVQPNERPESLSAEQEQKLRSELALVKGNLTVMSEMLNELVPGQSQPDDTELLQQLYTVCKCMQTRVVELIPQLLDEGFIEEMLVVNDDLNNAFIRYERFDRLNKAQITQSTQQQSSTSSPSVIKVSTELPTLGQPAVITTTNQPAVSTWANQRQLANHKEEEEFDMFAQTRGSSLAEQRKSVRYEDPGAVEGLAGALDTRLQVTGGMPPTKNFLHNDIDKWLSCDMEEQSSVCEGVSSEEFDKFLEDRARAGDHSSQGIRSVPSSASRPQPQSTRQQDRSHDQLFSL
ncbi:target of Myb protein 1-like isoform X5 [Scophthalmus maximus]|uniref:target of Myb protein 1-like isoform X5 n=1 Tax=Scophthalmus maximus TaxID=52904 RepID=UPI001FA8E953|nr:target of Myb protein 1-like isoform X5 [Scophthalmus maximus]